LDSPRCPFFGYGDSREQRHLLPVVVRRISATPRPRATRSRSPRQARAPDEPHELGGAAPFGVLWRERRRLHKSSRALDSEVRHRRDRLRTDRADGRARLAGQPPHATASLPQLRRPRGAHRLEVRCRPATTPGASDAPAVREDRPEGVSVGPLTPHGCCPRPRRLGRRHDRGSSQWSDS
jgi:hypothetical protein